MDGNINFEKLGLNEGKKCYVTWVKPDMSQSVKMICSQYRCCFEKVKNIGRRDKIGSVR